MTRLIKRPTIAAIRAAVLAEPNMPVSNLIDEMIAREHPNGDEFTPDEIEERFVVYGWAMEKANPIREADEAKHARRMKGWSHNSVGDLMFEGEVQTAGSQPAAPGLLESLNFDDDEPDDRDLSQKFGNRRAFPGMSGIPNHGHTHGMSGIPDVSLQDRLNAAEKALKDIERYNTTAAGKARNGAISGVVSSYFIGHSK